MLRGMLKPFRLKAVFISPGWARSVRPCVGSVARPDLGQPPDRMYRSLPPRRFQEAVVIVVIRVLGAKVAHFARHSQN